MTNFQNNIQTMLNNNFMKFSEHVNPKMREELGKGIIFQDTFEFTKKVPTQNFLQGQFPSLVEKQHARSFLNEVKTDSVQRLQASSKSAAARAFKFNIAAEIVFLLVKMYRIKNDTHMTNDQKTRSNKREFGSSVCGVLGRLIGEGCMPIVGGYIGGFIGNMLGGAIGGAL